MMSTNFLFIEWKWTMENADGFTQFKDRNFVVVYGLSGICMILLQTVLQ